MILNRELNLNNDPLTAKDTSFVFARNVMCDGNGIVPDNGITLIDGLADIENIVGHIVGIDNKIYLLTSDSKIIEYDELNNSTVEINSAWHYEGGEIDGCVTSNISGEKILTIAEYTNKNEPLIYDRNITKAVAKVEKVPVNTPKGQYENFDVKNNTDIGYVDKDKSVLVDNKTVTNADGQRDIIRDDNTNITENELSNTNTTLGIKATDNTDVGRVSNYNDFYKINSKTRINYSKKLIALKHINLSYCSKDDDESIYTQNPKIPITNIKLNSYYARTIPNGVYVFYIRYEIRKDVYTKWYLASVPIFAGNPTEVATIQGGLKYINLHKDSTMSFVLNVEHLIQKNLSIYKKFQLGFIITHEDSNNARAWKTFSIDTDTIYFDYDDVSEISIDELTETTYGIYNVRNIAAFRNKLYISNYVESDLNPKDTIELAKNIDVGIKVGNPISNGNETNDFTKLNGKTLTWDNTKGYYIGFEGEGTFEDNESSRINLVNQLSHNKDIYGALVTSGSTHNEITAATFDMDWSGADEASYISVPRDHFSDEIGGLNFGSYIKIKKPSVLIVDNIVSKNKGYKEFGNNKKVSSPIPDMFSITRCTGEDLTRIAAIINYNNNRGGYVNSHPWWGRGLPIGYASVRKETYTKHKELETKLPKHISILKNGELQTFNGIGYGDGNHRLDSTIGFLAMSSEFDNTGDKIQEDALSNAKEDIEKSIEKYSRVKFASCYIVVGTKKYYIGGVPNNNLEDDDFIIDDNLVWTNEELGYTKSTNKLNKDVIINNNDFNNRISRLIKNAIVGINKDCESFVLKTYDIDGNEFIESNINKIYIEFKQYNFTCDANSDNSDTVKFDGNLEDKYIHYHRVIKMKTVDYIIPTTLGFVDGSINFVGEKNTIRESTPTLMPMSEYDVYAHFIDEHGVITNGVLCSHIETSDVSKDASNIYITSKYTNTDIGKYRGYFLSVINTGPIIIELFNVTVRNGYVYAESIEIDTLLFALNDNITIINGNYRSNVQQKVITTSAVYYSSGCSTPLEAFGNVGFIRWKATDDNITGSKLYAIIKRKTNTNNDALSLQKSTPYYSLDKINVENSSYNNDFYKSYLCEITKPVFDIANTMYVSGNNVLIADKGNNNKDVLNLTDYSEPVEQNRGSKHMVHCNYNLQYLSTTKDIDNQIFTYGSGSNKSKEVAKMIDSSILSSIYILPGMYKDFSYQEFTNRNEYAKTDFDNTVRMSNSLLDESANNSIYTFFGTDYYNIPTDRGIIVKLFHIGNNIFIHTNKALYKFDGNQTLETTDKDITLKNADVFETGLTQLLDSEYGYAGLNNKRSGVITFDSYFFYDSASKHIFSYAGQSQFTIIDNTIWKFLKSFNADECYTIADISNNRIFFDLVNTSNNTHVCLSYNYAIKQFISVHDLTLKKAFNSQILCYNYENNFVSLFTGNLYDTDYYKCFKRSDINGIAKQQLDDNDSKNEYQNTDLDCELSIIVFPISSQVESLESIQLYINEIQADLTPRVNKFNPIRNLVVTTDFCMSNVTDTTNRDNVLDYKGFKYTKGFWTVNYFRNILNQDDVYNYTKDDKDAKVRQRLNMLINDQNSLMYGRYFIITFRSQYKFKLEAVSINTNTYN